MLRAQRKRGTTSLSSQKRSQTKKNMPTKIVASKDNKARQRRFRKNEKKRINRVFQPAPKIPESELEKIEEPEEEEEEHYHWSGYSKKECENYPFLKGNQFIANSNFYSSGISKTKIKEGTVLNYIKTHKKEENLILVDGPHNWTRRHWVKKSQVIPDESNYYFRQVGDSVEPRDSILVTLEDTMEKIMLPGLGSSDFRIEKVLKNKIRVRVVTIGTKYGIWPRSNRKYKCLEGKKTFYWC